MSHRLNYRCTAGIFSVFFLWFQTYVAYTRKALRTFMMLTLGQFFCHITSDFGELSAFFIISVISTAVASNRPTEALASVISFTFVVYSHYKHS